MLKLPASMEGHRVRARHDDSVRAGKVRYNPVKSVWFLGMAAGAGIGGLTHFTWPALALFLATTGAVLLFGHSLGSHRKLIHDSYQCPRWLEYLFVYLGVQVGLAGPLGLMRQHELRDYAQRLPDCHDYLRHAQPFWVDAWWQLNCELQLFNPPAIRIEPRVLEDRFYRFLERTWMAQQLPWAVLFFVWGGWSFVFWGVCARVTAGVFGHWVIGYFAHNHGPMHYEVRRAAVQGHNVPWTSLLTMGECWHNNHHAFPGSARLGLAAGEWDPGWWALVALRYAGLAWNLRLPHHLAARPELVAVQPRVERLPPPGRVVHDLGTLAGLCTVAPATRPTAPRLSYVDGGIRARGLPALCVAFARRGSLACVVALCLLPFAAAFERLRGAIDVAPSAAARAQARRARAQCRQAC